MVLLPDWAIGLLQLPLAQANEEKGLAGPILLLLGVVLINVVMIALAIRLRRRLRAIEDQKPKE
ncbi:hypothetical protein F8S13_23800 [Chloroflexia bacterium SDU3-3]|nr:hypothetical protein F8S13_23800 [Chloroflexia bacterium SDU3-3]